MHVQEEELQQEVQSDAMSCLVQQLSQIGPVTLMQMDRRAFTLQPLIAQGILHPGDNRLSCAVGGIDYYAGKMPKIPAMHRFPSY